MIICTDIQHIGQPSRPLDRGAVAFGHAEVEFTQRYARRLAELLTIVGHAVTILDSGEYRARHQAANDMKADLYLACHVNAGGGDYSLVETQYNARSTTAALARIIVDNFARNIPTSRGVVRRLSPNERGWRCFAGIKRPATLILEPFFIDDFEAHNRCWTDDGIAAITRSIFEAIQGNK